MLRGIHRPTLGKAVIDCGRDTARGALLKILGNSCILGTIELLSKVLLLPRKLASMWPCFYEFIRPFSFPCFISVTLPLTLFMRSLVSRSRLDQL